MLWLPFNLKYFLHYIPCSNLILFSSFISILPFIKWLREQRVRMNVLFQKEGKLHPPPHLKILFSLLICFCLFFCQTPCTEEGLSCKVDICYRNRLSKEQILLFWRIKWLINSENHRGTENVSVCLLLCFSASFVKYSHAGRKGCSHGKDERSW